MKTCLLVSTLIMTVLHSGLTQNVGIGTSTPTAKLEVVGDVKVNGKISNVTNPTSAQDVATKAYVDLLEEQVMQLQGVKDIENNKYEIDTIGTQIWMAENLRVTRYNDGTIIPIVMDSLEWPSLTSPGCTWYNNGNSVYGALYNYYTVADSNSRNVCPVGWHIPTQAEWTILSDELGDLTVAGGKMKESGLAHWAPPNNAATNLSGFAGLPGGYRSNNGSYHDVGVAGVWWSSTENGVNTAWYRDLFYEHGEFSEGFFSKRSGFSVRCIKD